MMLWKPEEKGEEVEKLTTNNKGKMERASEYAQKGTWKSRKQQRKETNDSSKKYCVIIWQEKSILDYDPNDNSFHTYRSYRGH